MEPSRIEDVLGLDEPVRTPLDLVDLGGKGVRKSAVTLLAKRLSVGIKAMAQLLGVNERTIQRHGPAKTLNRTISERLLRIALVTARGEEVFEDEERFLKWLKQPNQAIDYRTPLSLLVSDFGIDLVLDELGRIEHGIIS